MKEYFRHFRFYMVVGLLFALIYVAFRGLLLRGYGVSLPEEEFFSGGSLVALYSVVAFTSVLALSAIFSAVDVWIIQPLLFRKPLTVVFAVSFGLAIFILFGMSILVDLGIHAFINANFSETGEHAPYEDMLVWIGFSFLIVAFSRLLIEIDLKLGPGNLWKMLTGRFYRPREQVRIFMIVDLKGSTTIAEELGHLTYSKLIADCFTDFAVVSRFNAQVYQYVGDEVVISWPLRDARNYRRFLEAFFAFEKAIADRKEYYQSNYGLVPEFKAGAHVGPVVVTEVGALKREISYHGDTINTTSRIQGSCNQMGARLLISQQLFDVVQAYTPFQIEDVGELTLRGKQEQVRLFKVTQA